LVSRPARLVHLALANRELGIDFRAKLMIFARPGKRSGRNVLTTIKVRVKPYSEDYASIVPVTVPDLDEVRKFAAKLHARGEAWQGEAFGWPAEYNPE